MSGDINGFFTVSSGELDTNAWNIEQTNTPSDTITDDIYHEGNVGFGDFSSKDVIGQIHAYGDGENMVYLEGTPSDTSPEIVLVNPDNTTNGNTVTITNRDGVILRVEDGPTPVFTIEDNRQFQFHQYGDGLYTSGTPTYNLSVLSDGRIIERPYRLANPGDPVITAGGTGLAITQTTILDRWSTDYMYSYRVRVLTSITGNTGWGWINIPTKAGFQQPKIGAIGTYRNQTRSVQEDSQGGVGGDGASPLGQFMGSEAHHWTSTNRIYNGYNRRDNDYTMYIEFTVDYIKT